MTPARLAELRRLCEEATPGPWDVMGLGNQLRCGGGWLADLLANEDAAFIAAARSALPELIAEVERLTKKYVRHCTVCGALLGLYVPAAGPCESCEP